MAPAPGASGPAFGLSPLSNVVPDGPWEIDALSAVRLAALLALVTGVLNLLVLTLGNVSSFFSETQTSSGTVLNVTFPTLLAVDVAVGAFFGLSEVYLFRQAFRTMARGQVREFATPSTLSLLAFLGLIVVFAGFGVLLLAIYRLIQCVGPGNPVTAACLPQGLFWGAIALLVVGAVVGVVGYIGLLIGIWRLGRRYNDSMFTAGTVLLLFPFLDLIGAIFILWGAQRQIDRLRRQPRPAV